MPTTIAPSLGQSPEWLQLGPGAASLYGAIDHRRAMTAGLQEGALGVSGGAYKTTLSSGMNLTIAASTGDGALVLGDSITAQGLYYVPPHSAAIIETVTAAHATLPRIDSVVLEVLDASHDGGASNLARVRIIAGTATSGATLDNRTGAPALPATAMLLADVLVPAAAGSILAANIRDRRRWATGARRMIQRTTNAAAGSDYTTASGSNVAIDSTNLSPRIECSGVPVRVWLLGSSSLSVVTSVTFYVLLNDGTAANGADAFRDQSKAAGYVSILTPQFVFTPSVGSHLLAPAWRVSAGTATILTSAAAPLTMVVEELVGQNADNT